MNPNSHRPKLTESDVEHALEAMRTGQPLGDHSLRYFLTILNRLASPHVLTGDAAVQVAVFAHLIEVISGHLSEIRQTYNLPPPDRSGSIQELRMDYQQSNMELEAWSLLYHRYVCIDRAFSMQRLAEEAYQDERTLRRRQNLGITRLTRDLIHLEQAARQIERRRRLQLALPQAHAPTLIGIDSLFGTAHHLLVGAERPHHLLVHGPAGIGKTALALAMADALVTSDDPALQLEDVLWLDISNLSTSTEALTLELVTRLGLPQQSDHGHPRQLLRGYLSMHPVLLILDRAESLLSNPAHAEAALTLLDLAYVILTSQIKAPGHLWLSEITVPELKREDALQLVDQLATRHDSVQHANLLRRFETVWEIAGGNPLALKILLSTSHLPPAIVAEQLQIKSLHLQSWERLSPYERQVWLLPLLFPVNGLPYDQIRCLVEMDEYLISSAVNTLTQAALLMVHIRHEMPYYTLPTITTTFLMNQILSGELVDTEISTYIFFREALERAVTFLASHPDPSTAIFILNLAGELSIPTSDCRQYVLLLADQIVEAGLWQAWSERLQSLLENEKDPFYEAWLSSMLGTALRWTGQTTRAADYLQRALSLQEYNSPESAHVAVELAVVYRYQGRWQESHQLLQDAFDVYNRFNLSAGIERCIHELSQLSLEAHDSIRALTTLSKLESWSARAWGIASQVYLALEQFDDALQAARQALDWLPVYHPNQGRMLATLGQIYTARGELKSAIDYLRWAMDLLDQSKDALGYARACNNLAAVYLTQNPADRSTSIEEIRQLLEQALQIQTQTGDEIGMATTRQNLTWLDSLQSRP